MVLNAAFALGAMSGWFAPFPSQATVVLRLRWATTMLSLVRGLQTASY